jgi:hypothetical protein
MADTLKNIRALKWHHPNLAELQYITRLCEMEKASGFGFGCLDHYLQQLTGGLTSVVTRFIFILILVTGWLTYFYYCRIHSIQLTYALAPPPVILQHIQQSYPPAGGLPPGYYYGRPDNPEDF